MTDPPARPSPPGPAAPQTILVVDDDASIRRLFGTVLGAAGFAVTTVGDGRAALEATERERFDAILLDNAMPGLDGLATLEALRATEATSAVPIIMVTGAADIADRVAGLEGGATDYLVKPVDPDELVARVRAHLRQRWALRRAIDQRLRARAQVAGRLAEAAAHSAPAALAGTLCEELLELEEVAAATIVAFPGPGRGQVLGRGGHAAVEPGPLPGAVARRLGQRAQGSAWLEHRHEQPPGTTAIPLLPRRAAAAAFIPLRRSDFAGLLALSPPARSAQTAARCLSVGVDLAPLIAALLSSAVAGNGIAARRDELRRSVLEAEGFWPVFQPIVDLATNEVCGFEALTRFADGAPPAERFAEAAELGLGHDLERATATAAVGAARGLPGEAWLAINVSPAVLADDGLHAALGSTDRPIVLELTERDPVDDYDAVRAALGRIEPDVQLSIDDAGSGYACLGHVLALQPTFVKLDRTWVSTIDSDPARQALVAGLLSFSRETGTTLIAEGVEESTELAALTRLGVPLGQGFLLGRPAPEHREAAPPLRG